MTDEEVSTDVAILRAVIRAGGDMGAYSRIYDGNEQENAPPMARTHMRGRNFEACFTCNLDAIFCNPESPHNIGTNTR